MSDSLGFSEIAITGTGYGFRPFHGVKYLRFLKLPKGKKSQFPTTGGIGSLMQDKARIRAPLQIDGKASNYNGFRPIQCAIQNYTDFTISTTNVS